MNVDSKIYHTSNYRIMADFEDRSYEIVQRPLIDFKWFYLFLHKPDILKQYIYFLSGIHVIDNPFRLNFKKEKKNPVP